MVIDREIKQPEWASNEESARKTVWWCRYGLCTFTVSEQDSSWGFTIFGADDLEIESIGYDDAEQAKAAAFSAYLNLIFH